MALHRMHKDIVKSQHPTWSDDHIQLEQHNKFVWWFRDYVSLLAFTYFFILKRYCLKSILTYSCLLCF